MTRHFKVLFLLEYFRSLISLEKLHVDVMAFLPEFATY